MGQDGGVDIRGLEIANRPNADISEEDEQDSERSLPSQPREWRIQCKRYQTIGPKLIRQVVQEAIPDVDNPPYGLIVAAACDVSAKAIAAFHEERASRGATIGHLWTKAHLEDILFQPRNDHLLFAYFGISLQTRRRSRLQRVQAELALKRKLLRAFKVEELSEITYKEVLIRNLEFDAGLLETIQHAPTNDYSPLPEWFPAWIVGVYSRGLIVQRFVYDGWITKDGGWDFLLSSARRFVGSVAMHREN